jgi:hypothetical protein
VTNRNRSHVTLIAHDYRAEMSRMSGWRDRIDRTSNWAITVVGAMLFGGAIDVYCSSRRPALRHGSGAASARDRAERLMPHEAHGRGALKGRSGQRRPDLTSARSSFSWAHSTPCCNRFLSRF